MVGQSRHQKMATPYLPIVLPSSSSSFVFYWLPPSFVWCVAQPFVCILLAPTFWVCELSCGACVCKHANHGAAERAGRASSPGRSRARPVRLRPNAAWSWRRPGRHAWPASGYPGGFSRWVQLRLLATVGHRSSRLLPLPVCRLARRLRPWGRYPRAIRCWLRRSVMASGLL